MQTGERFINSLPNGSAAVKNNNDRAQSALQALDPGTNRDTWLRIAMAAKAAGLTLEDFTEWSRPAPNFGGERECARLEFATIRDHRSPDHDRERRHAVALEAVEVVRGEREQNRGGRVRRVRHR